MTSTVHRLMLVIAAVGLFSAPVALVRAEDTDPAALAKALNDTTVTLQDGLKASEREGKPISGKFEIEHDALQLSVYTLKGNDFIEAVANPKTGAVAKAEKITDADDLKAAAAQKAAMDKATVSPLAAADAAAKANAGLPAVSIYPELRNGHPVAEVTLLQGTVLKKVTEKLD
jgi:hypothetical protein